MLALRLFGGNVLLGVFCCFVRRLLEEIEPVISFMFGSLSVQADLRTPASFPLILMITEVLLEINCNIIQTYNKEVYNAYYT